MKDNTTEEKGLVATSSSCPYCWMQSDDKGTTFKCSRQCLQLQTSKNKALLAITPKQRN